MSVAFRRESDDEHLEPTFELPIPPGPNLVTARGRALIAAKVETLAAALAALGDLPVGREAAKTQEGAKAEALRRDLRYWRTRLATAEPAPPAAPGVVGIGSRVSFTLAGKPRTVTVTGHDEADPESGLIAFSAPLARALIGLEAGDFADFAGREDAIEVTEVSP